MAKQSWVVTDVATGVAVDPLTLNSQLTPAVPNGVSIQKRTLRGGLRDGLEVVEVDNGRLRFTILLTRGMGIWRAWCGAMQLGWQAPIPGPVHPRWVNRWEPTGLGWLDGFDELLVRCGLENNGAAEFDENGVLRYPLHGRIANLPASRVEITADQESGEIAVCGEVYETRLFFSKLKLTTQIRTIANSSAFSVTDTVSNIGSTPAEMELLYHINFGPPVLEPGGKVLFPIRRMAPRDATAAAEMDRWDSYGPGVPGKPETAYYAQLLGDGRGDSLAMIHNESVTLGVRVDFNVNELPCFTLWKNEQPTCDGYVSGLEPAVNFPNRRSFEKAQGRVITLRPGESRSCTVSITGLTSSDAVAAARDEVLRLQTQCPPEVLHQPQPEWSP